MSTDNNNMMLPEEALNRFQLPDTALLGLEISSHDYKPPRYGFKIGDLGFLISSEVLCEVMKNFRIYPIPKTEAWLHGLVNLRGNLVPVYDLAILLGISDVPTKHENLLIVDRGPESAGILIDSLPQSFEVNRMNELSQVPKLPAGLSDCVSGAYSKDDVIWLEFNHYEFFSSLKESIAR